MPHEIWFISRSQSALKFPDFDGEALIALSVEINNINKRVIGLMNEKCTTRCEVCHDSLLLENNKKHN